jgi:hypothetical protein
VLPDCSGAAVTRTGYRITVLDFLPSLLSPTQHFLQRLDLVHPKVYLACAIMVCCYYVFNICPKSVTLLIVITMKSPYTIYMF